MGVNPDINAYAHRNQVRQSVARALVNQIQNTRVLSQAILNDAKNGMIK